MMSKTDRTVLVTGATSGIGKEVAIIFAKKGWNVICHYFSSDKKADDIKAQIIRYGVECHLIKCDFFSERKIKKFIKEIRNFNIASLVNNAGTYTVRSHFSKLTLPEIIKTFMVNVFAPILISSELIKNMKKVKFGRIVNISSIAAKFGGSSYSMHYGCSKRALEGVTKTLAREGAGFNILVNTIRPGLIDTEFHKKFPKDMKKRIALIPLKRMGNPFDIADMVYYIGSERNNFITNQTIAVSGGE